jgi:hypothetical protein
MIRCLVIAIIVLIATTITPRALSNSYITTEHTEWPVVILKVLDRQYIMDHPGSAVRLWINPN